MIQRMVALIAALVIGLALFISGIANLNTTFIGLGFCIAALPCFFFGYLIYDRAKDKARDSNNKGKFTIIYRLLSKKTFDSYMPSTSSNITKGAAFVAYNNEKNKKSVSIKAKKERVYYTAERVTELVDSFASSYSNPEKISEYFFETANHFPCEESVLGKTKHEFSKEITEFNKKIDKLYVELWDDFAKRDESILKLNISILKNHKEKEATGLGFGLITNSASHALLYSALDADEREYQRLSNAPRLASTEEGDNKKLQEIYDKIITIYNKFIEDIRIILSNELLYERNEAQKREDLAAEKKHKTKIAIISVIIASIMLLSIIIGVVINANNNQAKKDKYDLAHNYITENKYGLAMDLFYELGEYEDSEYWYDYLNLQTNTKIKCGDFVKKYQLTTFEIPSNRTTIYEEEFKGCSSLQTITISNSIVEIEDFAFQYCRNIKSVIIPNSVRKIGFRAFAGCSSITSINLGAIETVESLAFENCSNLTSIIFSSQLSYLSSGMFSDCTSLVEVNIPNTITSISDSFYGCSSLSRVSIPNSVKSISGGAFSGCTDLIKIIIPISVEYMGNGVFTKCEKLTIYCEVTSKPSEWHIYWDTMWAYDDCPVVWGYTGD